MSFLNKKSSFFIFEMNNDITVDDLTVALQSIPLKDITNTSMISYAAFCKINDVFSQEFDVVNDLVGFSYREDYKILSKNLINKKLEEVVKEEEATTMQKVDKEMLVELRQGVIQELAFGVRPTEKTFDIIFDVKNKLAYVEKGNINLAARMVNLISSILKHEAKKEVEFNMYSPFSEKTSAQNDVSDCMNMFLAWLYFSSNRPSDKDGPKLKSKVALKEGKNQIVIQGDISRFFHIYESLDKKQRQITEASISAMEGDNERCSYSLCNKDVGVKNLFISGSTFTREEPISAILSKNSDFFNFKKHLESIVKLFEEEFDAHS